MKTLSFDPKKGIMKLILSDQDDLWIIYNIVQEGDRVYSRSSREIKVSSEGSRPTEGKRIAMFIGLQVQRTIFQKMSKKLRIHGIIIDAPEKYGLIGSHHTLTIEIRKPFTIVKNEWSKHDLDAIKRAHGWKTTPILIIAIDDEDCGLAILRQNTIQIREEIKANLPRKHEAEKRTGAIKRYFEKVVKAVIRERNREKALIAIVGPGFIKDTFTQFLKGKQPNIVDDISVVGLTSSAGVSGIREALRSGVLDRVTQKVRIIEETKAVKEVLHRLGSEKGDVTYGPDSVIRAVELGAVHLLLVSDKLLREGRDEERKYLENLMRKAEKMRGRVMIIGSSHEAGEQLLGLGGIAAQLRYPVDVS
jgi:protein pelota